MITSASMTKHIQVGNAYLDDGSDLFKRNGVSSKYRGFASFGVDDSASVLLEVADTPDKKIKGLSGRSNLPACCGMLFINLTGGAFWMKGCKIPLDIVFIDDDDKISKMYTMEVDDGVKRYPYDYEETAIELPAGFCSTHEIKIGTSCKWRIW